MYNTFFFITNVGKYMYVYIFHRGQHGRLGLPECDASVNKDLINYNNSVIIIVIIKLVTLRQGYSMAKTTEQTQIKNQQFLINECLCK